MEGISELGAILLEAIKTEDKPISRIEIAQKIGRKQLYPYDVEVLKQLVDKGLVQESREKTGVARVEYRYTALS